MRSTALRDRTPRVWHVTPAAPADVQRSASWATGPTPKVSVHVPTHRRAAFLPELIDCLAGQTLDRDHFEVVVVDDGSGDDTWDVLGALTSTTSLRVAVLRLAPNRGAAGARNAAVAQSRAEVLAFTDDDCLPAPGWLAALLEAADGADVVQGRTEPEPPRHGTGPWARTIRIVDRTPLFETCNIAYRRGAFDRAGGFDEGHAARAGGHAIGEDVLLGSAVVEAGGRHEFAPGALVHHRYLPASYRDHVRAMRELSGFPGLARESRVLADALWARAFLTARTASFDLALVGTALAVARRQPALLAAVVPWVVRTWPMAQAHGGRPPVVRLAQLAVADAVGAAALIEGSVRHRRLVL